MQKLIAYLLLLSLALPFGIKTGMYVDYAVRYDYYKNEICENKNQPELQCNGTCQLAKFLAEQEPKAPEVPENLNQEIAPFLIPSLNIKTHIVPLIAHNQFNYFFSVKLFNCTPLSPPPIL